MELIKLMIKLYHTAIKDSQKEGFGFLNRHKASGIYDDMKNISNTNYDNETLWFYEDILDAMFNNYLENKQFIYKFLYPNAYTYNR